MNINEAKLDAAMDDLEKARANWWDGYRNNYPQQDALNDAIARAIHAAERNARAQRDINEGLEQAYRNFKPGDETSTKTLMNAIVRAIRGGTPGHVPPEHRVRGDKHEQAETLHRVQQELKR